MSNYHFETPSLDMDPKVQTFFQDFYAASDAPHAHEQYAQYFTHDATLILASKKVQGRNEIIALRKSMWEKVSSRLHKPIKVFPFGSNSNEVMLYGTVKYGLKDGGDKEVDWAARANLVNEEGKARMSFYQVYLDTAAQAK
ncbi:hypothetical protein ACEQ8H_006697 [Pleosporales sp. CAS-2024a]